MPESAGTEMDDIKAILEALIYVSEEPVKEEEILGVFPADRSEIVHRALEELVLEYSAVPRGLRIVRVAGGYRMQTRPEHDPWIRSLYRLRNRIRLSRAALETLAIVAYRQPVTAPEIQSIRGAHPVGVIQTLLERRLIRTMGRKKVVGKPILYGTTEEFLVHFGLNSLADLPSLEDFPDLAQPETPFGEGIPAVLEGIPSEGPEVRAIPPGDEEEVFREGKAGEDLITAPPPGAVVTDTGGRNPDRPGQSCDEEE